MAKSPPTDAEKLLAADYQRKRASGQKTSDQEQRAFKKVVAHAAELARRKVLDEGIPKKEYVERSGRQHKTLDQQARLFGLTALLGDMVNISLLFKQFHDLLAEHGPKILDDEAGLMSGEDTPALEKWREVKYRRELLALEREQEQLIHRDAIHTYLQQMAASLRECGERIQRDCGPEALDSYNEMLATIEALSAELLAGMPTTPDELPEGE